MSVHKKLMQARVLLQNTKLEKSGNNKFAGYKYFELGDYLPAIQNIFASLDLCGVVSFTAEVASLVITDCESATSITITSPMGSAALKGCHEVQNIGAVETYQRRYLWQAALEIVEHDALEATTGKDTKKPIIPTSGAWEVLSDEEQKFLTAESEKIIKMIDDGDVKSSVKHLNSLCLDAEEKVAIWTRFDSKQRSAIKREQQSINDDVK